MPFHGKSNPPEGWTGEEYQLTTARYTETIRAFCNALKLDKPVVMGCSIGGRIVLNLAIDHASEFRALIGLEAADFQAPWYDTSWLHRPDVHGGEVCAAPGVGRLRRKAQAARRGHAVGLQAGRSRRVQGRPLFLPGRRRFARPGRRKIDTKICPLYLLTGEYDFSCMPEDTRRTAASIPGTRVTIMEEVGHFPMSENPTQFRRYIAPVLGEIAKTSTLSSKQGVQV
jgi:pimeloyl-ACP methyl ester carboxylesterase